MGRPGSGLPPGTGLPDVPIPTAAAVPPVALLKHAVHHDGVHVTPQETPAHPAPAASALLTGPEPQSFGPAGPQHLSEAQQESLRSGPSPGQAQASVFPWGCPLEEPFSSTCFSGSVSQNLENTRPCSPGGGLPVSSHGQSLVLQPRCHQTMAPAPWSRLPDPWSPVSGFLPLVFDP